MKASLKEKFAVLTVSLILAAGVVCCIFFIPHSDPWDDRLAIVAAVFAGVWAFGILPAYLFGMRWEAVRVARMNKDEAFRWGFFWGYCLKFLILFVPAILAPGLAFFYFFGTIPLN